MSFIISILACVISVASLVYSIRMWVIATKSLKRTKQSAWNIDRNLSTEQEEDK
jgi:hypothetical protein